MRSCLRTDRFPRPPVGESPGEQGTSVSQTSRARSARLMSTFRPDAVGSGQVGHEEDLVGLSGEELDGFVRFGEVQAVGDEPVEVQLAGLHQEQ